MLTFGRMLPNDLPESASVAAAPQTPVSSDAAKRVAACLTALTALAAVATLYLARGFLIPLVIAVLLSYLLRPLVRRMEKLHIHRALGSALALIAVVAALGFAASSFNDNFGALFDKLPATAHQLRMAVMREDPGPLQNVQKAANELQAAALTATGAAVSQAPPPPHAGVQDYLLTQSMLLISTLAQAPVILLLSYFLLVSGGYFKQLLMQHAGSRLGPRDVSALLHDLDYQIQGYMVVMVVSNILVGVATWLGFRLFGMEHPEIWGFCAGVLHFIPYLGTAAVAAAAAALAYLKFGSLPYALGIACAFLAWSGIVGMGFMTWAQGRYARINSALLFVGLLFFAWLWGFWGLLLGAPLISIAKVVWDRLRAAEKPAENTPAETATAAKTL